VCFDYFLNVETITSPRRKARMNVDALKEINPIKTIPLLLISSPRFIRTRERRKQMLVSKAILMLVFFIVFVCLFVDANIILYLEQ
jgi:hypothetical protein